jgi:hypothetical protein
MCGDTAWPAPGRQAFRDRQVRELAERRQQVRPLVQAGLTSAEVFERLGVSPATISLDRGALRLGRALTPPEHRTLRDWAWTRRGTA